MRSIGLDIHRDFAEVAIAEGGEIRSAGRIEMTPEALELFAQSLGRDDRVALEVSGNAWEVARIIRPHVAKLVVGLPGRHRDPLRAGEDRPPRRPGAGEAAGRGPARLGLGPRRGDPGDAPAAGAPSAARESEDEGEERDPRRAHAQAGHKAQGQRSLRGQGPSLAGGARAAGLRARDRRRLHAPARLLRGGDRSDRARDRRRGASPRPRSAA